MTPGLMQIARSLGLKTMLGCMIRHELIEDLLSLGTGVKPGEHGGLRQNEGAHKLGVTNDQKQRSVGPIGFGNDMAAPEFQLSDNCRQILRVYSG